MKVKLNFSSLHELFSHTQEFLHEPKALDLEVMRLELSSSLMRLDHNPLLTATPLHVADLKELVSSTLAVHEARNLLPIYSLHMRIPFRLRNDEADAYIRQQLIPGFKYEVSPIGSNGTTIFQASIGYQLPSYVLRNKPSIPANAMDTELLEKMTELSSTLGLQNVLPVRKA